MWRNLFGGECWFYSEWAFTSATKVLGTTKDRVFMEEWKLPFVSYQEVQSGWKDHWVGPLSVQSHSALQTGKHRSQSQVYKACQLTLEYQFGAKLIVLFNIHKVPRTRQPWLMNIIPWVLVITYIHVFKSNPLRNYIFPFTGTNRRAWWRRAILLLVRLIPISDWWWWRSHFSPASSESK